MQTFKTYYIYLSGQMIGSKTSVGFLSMWLKKLDNTAEKPPWVILKYYCIIWLCNVLCVQTENKWRSKRMFNKMLFSWSVSGILKKWREGKSSEVSICQWAGRSKGYSYIHTDNTVKYCECSEHKSLITNTWKWNWNLGKQSTEHKEHNCRLHTV